MKTYRPVNEHKHISVLHNSVNELLHNNLCERPHTYFCVSVNEHIHISVIEHKHIFQSCYLERLHCKIAQYFLLKYICSHLISCEEYHGNSDIKIFLLSITFTMYKIAQCFSSNISSLLIVSE